MRALLVRWTALLATALLVTACAERLPVSSSGAVSPNARTPAQPDDFARVTGVPLLSFPRDSGPHPDFQTEWWYYTGNLVAEQGDRFGFQLTIFRRGLVPRRERVKRTSRWAANDIYMAHVALTDVREGRHHAEERLARGALDLAGAEATPYRVWVGNWQAQGNGADSGITLRAAARDFDLDLSLSQTKPRVLHGDDGYSRKGSDPGNASAYYSETALATVGSVTVGGRTVQVTGKSWMDHEYSTSALEAGQVGWDWFALQTDDQRELMLFQVRRADGRADPNSAGTLIEPSGAARSLEGDEFTVRPIDSWRSPHTGAVYPSGWMIEAPGVDLEVRPLLTDQEVNLSFHYWEGAVRITGRRNGQPVHGFGYVELTGYAGSMEGRF